MNDTLKQFQDTVARLHAFANYMSQSSSLAQNEALTREQLVRPLFKALGYVTEATDDMQLDLWPEDTTQNQKHPDYIFNRYYSQGLTHLIPDSLGKSIHNNDEICIRLQSIDNLRLLKDAIVACFKNMLDSKHK